MEKSPSLNAINIGSAKGTVHKGECARFPFSGGGGGG